MPSPAYKLAVPTVSEIAEATDDLADVLGSATPAELAETLSEIEQEVRRRRWLKDPAAWAAQRLNVTLTSYQVDIMLSVRDNRRTAVMSCHEIGKSFITALIACWWIDTHPPGEAFVVTSAPTGPQVKAILWREIGRLHARANLVGRVNQTEWLITMPEGNEELVAFGRKPDEYDATAFQGIHARFVLVVFDEACGIAAPLWVAADSLIANDYGKMLVIGNPDDPKTEFYEACKPGSGYKVFQIGAFDTPNFTGEKMPQRVLDELIGRVSVEEKRRKWAPQWYWVDRAGAPCAPEVGVRVVPPEGVIDTDTNPLWQSKILGRFPLIGEEGGLLPITWVRNAQLRALVPADDAPSELGVDVGGGGDASTIAYRKGGVVRVISETHNPDTMNTCGSAITFMRERHAHIVKVDSIGIGRGVVDRAKEQKHNFIAINVGEKPDKTEDFVNRRAELWWMVRELFETGQIDIDPHDEDLAAELCSIRYKRQSTGKIQIESKVEAKRRGVPSPNRAEALMLAFAKPKRKFNRATWGRS